jgi:hypothetical protein
LSIAGGLPARVVRCPASASDASYRIGDGGGRDGLLDTGHIRRRQFDRGRGILTRAEAASRPEQYLIDEMRQMTDSMTLSPTRTVMCASTSRRKSVLIPR